MTAREDGSGDSAGTTVNAVSALMDERRRYEAWIDALHEKRGGTPDHVFTRVLADYRARLDAVIGRLSTHADGLRDEISRLTAELSGMREDQQRATDERAEAELRAHVGELSAPEWQRVADASDERLGELASRSGAIEHELSRTRQLLDDTERPRAADSKAAEPPESAQATSDVAEGSAHVPASPAPDPVVVSASVPEVAAQAAEPVPASVAPAPQAAPSPPPAPRSSQAMPAPAPRPSVPISAPRTSGGFDELSFLRSVVDTPAGTSETAAPRDEPDEASKIDTFATRAREEAVRLSGEQQLIMRSSGEELARGSQQIAYQRTPGSALDPVKDPAIEGAKTLKCGECGCLNYPTEWYCERCGAELASL